MKKLILAKRPTPRKRLDVVGPTDAPLLIREDCVVEDGVSKQPVIVYLELARSAADETLERLEQALLSIRYETSFRTAALPTVSRIFGYSPRNVLRKDFCASASLNDEAPAAYRAILSGATLAEQHYVRWAPTRHAYHRQEAARVLPRWRLAKTPFTSGIVNRNNQLRYHFDSGNFKNVWSAMFVFKRHVEGGHLSCPEYGVSFELKEKSLLLFDGQSILHGVTPIKRLSPNAFRLSIVYYSLLQMWKCVSPSEELERIRLLKTQREIKRARA